MKKLFKYLRLQIAIFLGCLVFVACGSDNAPENNSGNTSGSTTLTKSVLQNYFWYRSWTDVDGTSSESYTNSFYFVTDSKGALVWTEKTVDIKEGENYSRGERYFSYTLSGNSVRITWEDTKATELYTYSGGNLKNSAGDIIQPKTLTTADKTYIQELKTKLEQTYADLVGSSYKNTDISGGMVTYTLTFTSSTACTLKFSGHNTSWQNISGSANGTYANNAGVITITGVYPNWDGKTATIKTGSAWGFELRPVGAMYQDNWSTYWTK